MCLCMEEVCRSCMCTCVVHVRACVCMYYARACMCVHTTKNEQWREVEDPEGQAR